LAAAATTQDGGGTADDLVAIEALGRRGRAAGATHERDAVGEDHARGIRRRGLWQQGGACAYLVRASEGALVPAHGCHHAEECQMLEGDRFPGDNLVCEGDLQLAPSGLVHGSVQAGSDCMVHIRGDAELALDLGDPNP
jgi:hypothetical protein